MLTLQRKLFASMACLMILAGSLASSRTALANDDGALTNADVIQLSQAGLGDAVVVAKIRQAARANFALDVDDIIALKNAGVGKDAIAAMLERSGGRPCRCQGLVRAEWAAGGVARADRIP